MNSQYCCCVPSKPEAANPICLVALGWNHRQTQIYPWQIMPSSLNDSMSYSSQLLMAGRPEPIPDSPMNPKNRG